jgi:hypothetical protein
MYSKRQLNNANCDAETMTPSNLDDTILYKNYHLWQNPECLEHQQHVIMVCRSLGRQSKLKICISEFRKASQSSVHGKVAVNITTRIRGYEHGEQGGAV